MPLVLLCALGPAGAGTLPSFPLVAAAVAKTQLRILPAIAAVIRQHVRLDLIVFSQKHRMYRVVIKIATSTALGTERVQQNAARPSTHSQLGEYRA